MDFRIRILIGVLTVVLGLGLPGCTVRVPFTPFYTPAPLVPEQMDVRLDIPYRTDADADQEKHRLDLYLPRSSGWPLLAFVHGGSLEKGDSAKRVAGHDIYRNIGRFYASRGVGVALINYRLQPDAKWPGQVDDVAGATSWLKDNMKQLGGNGRIFLSGHSAGSWLASQVALDREVQRRHGFGPADIDGVISISGSGFDLTDPTTWKMFGREETWQRRFSVTPDDPDWKQNASLVPLLHADAPPFLLLYSSREWRALQRQNQLMCEAAAAVAVECDLVEVQGEGHRRMVLAMSDADRQVAARILAALGVRDDRDDRVANGQSTTR